jgi:hypothetical protein
MKFQAQWDFEYPKPGKSPAHHQPNEPKTIGQDGYDHSCHAHVGQDK